jgi:hypothetical protein
MLNRETRFLEVNGALDIRDRIGDDRVAECSMVDLLKPSNAAVCDGLAKRGRRRAERPLSGWIRAGLESYIDSDK